MENKDRIEIPFGANDSELYGFEYTIPQGYEAEIKDGKVIIRKVESEDEKIRKDIIHHIEFDKSHNIIPCKRAESWIAYLEKQGDKDKLIKELGEYKVKYTQEVLSQQLEKQGKQHPQTKVIIPKFRVGDVIKTSNEEPLTITKIDDKGYWSMDLFICNFDDAVVWDIVEQKPAWSEEDKTIIESLIALCDDKIKTTGFTDVKEHAEKCRHWLKSLRPQPHWKPSDEQIAWCNIAKDCVGDTGREYLKSLYEDLKKLKD